QIRKREDFSPHWTDVPITSIYDCATSEDNLVDDAAGCQNEGSCQRHTGKEGSISGSSRVCSHHFYCPPSEFRLAIQVMKPNETSEHHSLMELPGWVARCARRSLLFTFVKLRAQYSKEQLKRREMDFSSLFQDGLHEVGNNIMEIKKTLMDLKNNW
ncbi:B-cell translocation gene 4, isoform CRA_a, partial [Mus musculus]